MSLQTVTRRTGLRMGSTGWLRACLSTEPPVPRPAASPATTPEPKRVRIYTRTGDRGTSALFTGERRPKDDLVFEALGTIDELSSTIGLARAYCASHPKATVTLDARLEKIQCLLQDVGGHVATPRTSAKPNQLGRTTFDELNVFPAELETWIDEMDADLPPLRAFILPGGGPASSALHLARTTCRRAERRVVPLIAAHQADDAIGRYLNRLSDFLFTAARYASYCSGIPDQTYTKYS